MKKIIILIKNKLSPFIKKNKEKVFFTGIAFLLVCLFYLVLETIKYDDVNRNQRELIFFISFCIGSTLIIITSQRGEKFIQEVLYLSLAVFVFSVSILLTLISASMELHILVDLTLFILISVSTSYLICFSSRIIKFVKNIPFDTAKQKFKIISGALLGLSTFLGLLYGILKYLYDIANNFLPLFKS